MSVFRIVYKLVILLYLAVIAVPVMLFLSLGSDEAAPNQKQKAYRQQWLKKVARVIGLDIEVVGYDKPSTAQANPHKNPQNNQKTNHALWVANHISWMDIVVLGSEGVGFLSKAEIRRWPIIGWLGEKSGTVFIQRGGKNASQRAAQAIAEKIQAGDNILVFPEATTSAGDTVKHFHARIFAPALDHHLTVQPLAVRYLNDAGEIHPRSIWADESFLANLIGVLAQARIHVTVTYLPEIPAQQFSERKPLAAFAESQIRSVIVTTTSTTPIK